MRTEIAVVAAALMCAVEGFSPASRSSALFRPANRVGVAPLSSTTLNAAAKAKMPNLLKSLPWNVKKEKEREARRLRQQSAQYHRELGIPEGATFEEITEACDKIKARHEGDYKKQVKTDITKDKIMQIRLNERLAGLGTETKEARAASMEESGALDLSEKVEDASEEVEVKQKTGPKWYQGIIVKPDEAWRNRQYKVWIGLSILGFLLPPVTEKLMYTNWLFAVGQMSTRGTATDGDYEMISGKKSKAHQKVSWFIGMCVWIVMTIAAKVITKRLGLAGSRIALSYELAIQNVVLGITTAYVKPYKGD
jgi:hypothetical protein